MLYLALASKFLAVSNDVIPLYETAFLRRYYMKNIILISICMVVVYVKVKWLSMSINMLPLIWFVYMKLI